jgi:Fe-S-cluster-containing hydrogenase component 2
MTMKRQIIHIDQEKCNGCGLCAQACHEGAIGMVDGKAQLLRDDYCDGMGDCLPACPAGAISFDERDTLPYNEKAVQEHKAKLAGLHELPCGCPGTQSRVFTRVETSSADSCCSTASAPAAHSAHSQLRQWPVQIKLAPVNAPYFSGAHLLIAADCTAYAYGNFHNDFIKGKVTLIGCPKLDAGDYTEKLAAIISENDIKSLTVVRMEVPCCGGIERAAVTALQQSGKFIPWQVITISTEGEILES